MASWMKLALVALLVLTAGCNGAPPPPAPEPAAPSAPAPDPVPAPAPRTDSERYRRYDELKSATMGTPYVSLWYLDGKQDKLVIGVSTLEAKQTVQRQMIKLGLPEDSVVIEHPKPLLSEAAPFEGCQVSERQPGGEDARLVIPAAMRSGQEFTLSVKLGGNPGEITRGVDSYLECWDGQAWSTRFLLQVGFGSPDAKPTAQIFGISSVVSLGLAGPGPERLVLPPNMPPGWYRLRKHVTAGMTGYDLTALFEVR